MSTSAASSYPLEPWPPEARSTREWVEDGNRVTFRRLSQDIGIVVLDGKLLVSTLDMLVPAITELFEESGAAHLYFDAERLESYQAQARDEMIKLVVKHRKRWRTLEVLYTSPLVGVGVTAANLVLRGALKGSRDRERFRQSVRDALAQRG